MLQRLQFVALSLLGIFALVQGHTPKGILVDIDIMGGIDDVGALAIANVFHNCGLANLLGVFINTPSKYGALATSAINTYFDNGNVPIAAMRPLSNETYFDDFTFMSGEYTSKVAHNFPRSLETSDQTPLPVEVYREVLSSAEDNSVTIVSLGYLDNLEALLNSEADSYSDLSGIDLATKKVVELVVMDGEYPDSDTIHFKYEFNFGGRTPLSTQIVINNLPTSITFSGYSLGVDVISGPSPSFSLSDSPVLASYEWYVGRGRTETSSWDGLTMLYAVLGLDRFQEIGIRNLFEFQNEFGYNSVSDDGSNAWVNDTTRTNQHWLGLIPGNSNSSVAAVLNQFYAKSSVQTSCAVH